MLRLLFPLLIGLFSVPALALDERTLGDPEAPVTLVEYASMTCPHCGNFHLNVLPQLKESYIDNGKMRLIYRDFPLDRVALLGAMLARCLPEQRYFRMVDAIYANQQAIVSAPDPRVVLAELAGHAGLSRDEIEACATNQSLANDILETRLSASEDYNINATPSFVIRDSLGEEEVLRGGMNFEQLAQEIEQRLN